MPRLRTVPSSLMRYTLASDIELWLPPTMCHTASFVTSSGYMSVKMIESRAPPEPPMATTWSMPKRLEHQPERLGAHVRLRLAVDLDVGLAAVRPVPQQHALAAGGERVRQLVDAAEVLAEPSARRHDADLAVLRAHPLVHDDPAVDLDLLVSHSASSSASA